MAMVTTVHEQRLNTVFTTARWRSIPNAADELKLGQNTQRKVVPEKISKLFFITTLNIPKYIYIFKV